MLQQQIMDLKEIAATLTKENHDLAQEVTEMLAAKLIC